MGKKYTKWVDVEAQNKQSAEKQARVLIKKKVGPTFTITEIKQIRCEEMDKSAKKTKRATFWEALETLNVLTSG
jgi:hypothetical protein